MKRCADSANLDWYEGAALMSLDSFAIVGGVLRVGRIFNRHPAFVVSGNSRGLEGDGWSQCFPGRVSPFLSRNGWVSREQLATTFRVLTILRAPLRGRPQVPVPCRGCPVWSLSHEGSSHGFEVLACGFRAGFVCADGTMTGSVDCRLCGRQLHCFDSG